MPLDRIYEIQLIVLLIVNAKLPVNNYALRCFAAFIRIAQARDRSFDRDRTGEKEKR